MYGLNTIAVSLVSLSCFTSVAAGSERVSRQEAEQALRKAVDFFRKEVSAEGGYLWRYSADLRLQEGENRASPTTAWVQPPGTPSVGDVYLDAYELTRDKSYLEAARETAGALVRGQLRSGGWDYRIEFDPKERRRYAYRVERETSERQRNTTTLDDNTTQSALRFLMRVDRILEFEDAEVHEAAHSALAALLKAQYPNGAWPQRYDEFPDAKQHPVKRANYPETWSRTHPEKNYQGYYTFNDNAMADVIDVMFQAAEVYGDQKYRQAAEKAGGFILLAQMPEPQPAWAQQYNRDMQPAWARRFEPPSITGGESRGVIRTLLALYRQTGEKKYLEPIPRAIAYLKKSRLSDGRLARFYELKTNKPLFFTKEYELTYSSDDMPTHYAFIVSGDLDSLEAEYQRLSKTDPKELRTSTIRIVKAPRMSSSLANRAREVIDALDGRGAWVEEGRMKNFDEGTTRIIDSRTFADRVETLAQFIGASQR